MVEVAGSHTVNHTIRVPDAEACETHWVYVCDRVESMEGRDCSVTLSHGGHVTSSLSDCVILSLFGEITCVLWKN